MGYGWNDKRVKNADGDFWLKKHHDHFKNIPVLDI